MLSNSLAEAKHLRTVLERIKEDLDTGRLETDDKQLPIEAANCLASLNAKMSAWEYAQRELFRHPGSSRFAEDAQLAEQGLQLAMIEGREVIRTIEKASGRSYLPSPNTAERTGKPTPHPNSGKIPGKEPQPPIRPEKSDIRPGTAPGPSSRNLWSIGLLLLLVFAIVLLGFGALTYFMMANPYLVVLVSILSIIMLIAISILALLYVHAISGPAALKILDKIVNGLLKVDFLRAIESWFRSKK